MLTVGLTVLVGLLLAGLFAPLPHDPTRPDPAATLMPPSGTHWFGTDVNGFDVFSRTIRAARTDLPLALIGTLVSALVGIPFGLVAGSRSRWSGVLMRALDIFQAFPLLVLAIAVVAVTGNNIRNVVLAIAIINVPRFIRLIRAEVLVLRESRFVEAATVIGCRPSRVMFRHVLPNVTGVVLAQTSLAAANAIIVVAALNFLGVGVDPPNPSWGGMIQDGSSVISQGKWWPTLFPSLAVLLAVLAFNLVADAVEGYFTR